MGIISKMKSEVKKSGGNKAKFTYFKNGTKLRLRFLQDLDDGYELHFHDSYEKGINCLCLEHLGKSCPYCDEPDDDIRFRSMYAWSVWNYDANEVQILMFAVNNCSPVPQLIAMNENYGTIMDRDYVIQQSGEQTSKSFTVIPMDRNSFKNTKAKPYSEKKVIEFAAKGWPYDGEEDDEEEEVPKKKQAKNKANDEDESGIPFYQGDDEDSGEESGYEDMSPKQLYNLCMEREIKNVMKKKPAKYYINLLEEYDKAQDDWSDDDDDDWGDDDDWEDE